MKFAPRQILCAVDFSKLSSLSLKYAAAFSHNYRATLLVLHAAQFELPPYFTHANYAWLRKQLTAQRRSARSYLLNHIRTVLGKAVNGLRVEVRIVEQHPVDAILETARQQTDLIVLGTHGRGGAQRLLLGSVAENVIRHAPVPVLAVREKQHEFIDVQHPDSTPPLKRILCPVNFTSAARATLEMATALAARFDAQLTVLHVAEPGETARAADALKQLCDGFHAGV